MRDASAFAPGHLTGFFQICDGPEDPLLKGARGSGFSITYGVHTRVTAEPAGHSSVTISINGEVTGAAVSERVVARMVSALERPYRLRVEHDVETPIGAGFGSSGGGALSLALALNEALGLGLSRIEAARAAHIAEIECRTGLGTVLAELSGGFGVLVKPGAPGIGEAVKFSHGGDLSAVCLPFGPIPTEEALSDPVLRRRINELGGGFVDELHRDQRPELFMQLSRRFAEHVGLITPRLRAVLDEADEAGVPCTMAMFGEVVFSLVESERADRVVEVFRDAAPGHDILVAGIDDEGARLT